MIWSIAGPAYDQPLLLLGNFLLEEPAWTLGYFCVHLAGDGDIDGGMDDMDTDLGGDTDIEGGDDDIEGGDDFGASDPATGGDEVAGRAER